MILEVIVSSLQDALEAEAGGADRLEVVRDLDSGGLTPPVDLVRQIAAFVHIPIRVMLRENSTMCLTDGGELRTLHSRAIEMRELEIDGYVAGFLKPATQEIDVDVLISLIAIAPEKKFTFHRAFDALPDPVSAIGLLKTIAPIDRILTVGGVGFWPERRARLHYWQRCAAPEITILAGAGLLPPVIADLQRDPHITEMHVGRAARIPQENQGVVSRLKVAQLKGMRA